MHGNYFPKKSNRQQGVPSGIHSGVLAILIEGLEACYLRGDNSQLICAQCELLLARICLGIVQGGDCDQWGSW